MGITGLLPQLKSITDGVNVVAYRNMTVGVDASCWLHKGVYGCATALALGQPAEGFVRFCVSWLDMLLANGVIPFFVFDGANLPAKQGTEAERKRSRDAAMEAGLAAHAKGDLGGAHNFFTRAVDVTPAMALQFIRVLRQRGVAYVVSPYEADAQLAYLSKTGIIQAVITEDSDLLPFGARRLLFKMDKAGDGQEIVRTRLAACEELSFAHWNDDMLLNMCILAGCDYLPSINGFGVRKAHEYVRKCKSTQRIMQMLKFEFHAIMPADYLQAFSRARLTFLHQRVWCPRTRKMSTVTPFPPTFNAQPGSGVLDFLGPEVPDLLGAAIADGLIDPISRLPFDSDMVPRGIGGGWGGSGAGASAAAPTSSSSFASALYAAGTAPAAGAASSASVAAPLPPRRLQQLLLPALMQQHPQHGAGTGGALQPNQQQQRNNVGTTLLPSPTLALGIDDIGACGEEVVPGPPTAPEYQYIMQQQQQQAVAAAAASSSPLPASGEVTRGAGGSSRAVFSSLAAIQASRAARIGPTASPLSAGPEHHDPGTGSPSSFSGPNGYPAVTPHPSIRGGVSAAATRTGGAATIGEGGGRGYDTASSSSGGASGGRPAVPFTVLPVNTSYPASSASSSTAAPSGGEFKRSRLWSTVPRGGVAAAAVIRESSSSSSSSIAFAEGGGAAVAKPLLQAAVAAAVPRLPDVSTAAAFSSGGHPFRHTLQFDESGSNVGAATDSNGGGGWRGAAPQLSRRVSSSFFASSSSATAAVYSAAAAASSTAMPQGSFAPPGPHACRGGYTDAAVIPAAAAAGGGGDCGPVGDRFAVTASGAEVLTCGPAGGSNGGGYGANSNVTSTFQFYEREEEEEEQPHPVGAHASAASLYHSGAADDAAAAEGRGRYHHPASSSSTGAGASGLAPAAPSASEWAGPSGPDLRTQSSSSRPKRALDGEGALDPRATAAGAALDLASLRGGGEVKNWTLGVGHRASSSSPVLPVPSPAQQQQGAAQGSPALQQQHQRAPGGSYVVLNMPSSSAAVVGASKARVGSKGQQQPTGSATQQQRQQAFSSSTSAAGLGDCGSGENGSDAAHLSGSPSAPVDGAVAGGGGLGVGVSRRGRGGGRPTVFISPAVSASLRHLRGGQGLQGTRTGPAGLLLPQPQLQRPLTSPHAQAMLAPPQGQQQEGEPFAEAGAEEGDPFAYPHAAPTSATFSSAAPSHGPSGLLGDPTAPTRAYPGSQQLTHSSGMPDVMRAPLYAPHGSDGEEGAATHTATVLPISTGGELLPGHSSAQQQQGFMQQLLHSASADPFTTASHQSRAAPPRGHNTAPGRRGSAAAAAAVRNGGGSSGYSPLSVSASSLLSRSRAAAASAAAAGASGGAPLAPRGVYFNFVAAEEEKEGADDAPDAGARGPFFSSSGPTHLHHQESSFPASLADPGGSAADHLQPRSSDHLQPHATSAAAVFAPRHLAEQHPMLGHNLSAAAGQQQPRLGRFSALVAVGGATSTAPSPGSEEEGLGGLLQHATAAAAAAGDAHRRPSSAASLGFGSILQYDAEAPPPLAGDRGGAQGLGATRASGGINGPSPLVEYAGGGEAGAAIAQPKAVFSPEEPRGRFQYDTDLL